MRTLTYAGIVTIKGPPARSGTEEGEAQGSFPTVPSRSRNFLEAGIVRLSCDNSKPGGQKCLPPALHYLAKPR